MDEQPQIGRIVLQELRREENQGSASPCFSPPAKAAVNTGQQSLALSPHVPTAAAPLTFTEVWEQENKMQESPFDSALFSSSLYPADGAFDACQPQPSPLPPKPKIQQLVGDSAGAFGQQWQTVQSHSRNTHSRTLDTVVAKAIISIISSLGGGPVEQGVCSMDNLAKQNPTPMP